MPHNVDSILQLARGFQSACILAAAVELDIFETLADGRLGAQAVAKRSHTDLRATTILLDALVALGLLKKHRQLYAIPPEVREVLCRRGNRNVVGMLLHTANMVRRWSQLPWTVRSGQPAPRTPGIRGEQSDAAAFIQAMNDINIAVSDRIVADLRQIRFRHLLDVGGASGTWTIAFLKLHPQAQATLFDLPHVVPMAQKRLREVGMLDRVKLVVGDYNIDALPAGADLAWISAIVHQNSRRQNRDLFAKVHAALQPGGWVMVRDIVMNNSRTAPAMGALFAVNMLVGTEGGGTFTFAELKEDLKSTGFKGPRMIRQDDGMHAVIGARKTA